MATKLTIKAADKSTYVINLAFEDEDGNAVIPDSIAWTLTDDAGTVINSRTSVAVAVPAASVDIVLSGNDLKYSDGRHRVLTVQAVYDSNLGSDLPLKDEVKFEIADLLIV